MQALRERVHLIVISALRETVNSASNASTQGAIDG